MQDSIQTQQAPATQQPSIPSSAPAPTQAYQSASAQTAQVSSPTPSVQQPVDQAPQAYQPQAEPQINPWQEAFNRLSASLSSQQSSQAQVPSYGTTQQAPVAPAQYQQPAASPSQASYSSAPSTSGLQTYLPQQTSAYSQATQTQAPISSSVESQQSNLASDEYLASVSAESLEVLNHFGAEAPALLNRYACTVEDALIAQAEATAEQIAKVEELVSNMETAKGVITAAAEDNAAYHTMMTDPDLLSEYVNDFFGPEGPYPVETAEDRLAAEIAASDSRFQPEAVQQPAAPQFERPQMDIPTPGTQASAGSDDFWANFAAISEKNPSAAWQILSQAGPDALRSKVLVSEG